MAVILWFFTIIFSLFLLLGLFAWLLCGLDKLIDILVFPIKKIQKFLLSKLKLKNKDSSIVQNTSLFVSYVIFGVGFLLAVGIVSLFIF